MGCLRAPTKAKMKMLKTTVGGLLAAGVLLTVWVSQAADEAKTVKPYPLKTCVVSGEQLGGMGESYVFTNDNREIKLCCKGCIKEFEKNPKKYLKKLDAAEKKTK
jgi:hypothetical protein